jgi:hypothetical protein
MTIKYEIKRFDKNRIVPINCVKETDKTLWIEFVDWQGRKGVYQRRKCSDFHDTWQSAHDFLIATAHSRISGAKRSLQEAEADLAEIESLTDAP